MTVRHASKLTRAQRRDLHKQDRRTRQAKSRRMQHETLEARQLLAADIPQLIGIQPNSGELIEENDIRGISPRELVFNFAEGADADDLLNPATLSKGIIISRAGLDGKLGTGDDVQIVGPNANFEGFIGIGDKPNQVIVRFGEALPDDLYRIEITSDLTDMEGDAAEGFVRNFELNLAPQVMSVVPQPVTRNETTGALEIARDTIHVYFNDDDLDPALANNPEFYQLSYQVPGGSTNNDLGLQNGELAFYPSEVTYDPVLDRAILKFDSDIEQLIGSTPSNAGVASVFRLQIGVKGIASKTGQILDLSNQGVGSSFETAFELSNFSGKLQNDSGFDDFSNVDLFGGNNEFRVTRGAADVAGTTFTIDDGRGNLRTFELTDAAVGTYSGLNVPVYLDTAGTTSVQLASAIRDAINGEASATFNVAVSAVPNASPDRMQLRGTDQNRVSMILGDNSVGLIVDRSQALVIRGEIQNEQFYNLPNMPGGNDEPGHRDIELGGENHLSGSDSSNGIVYYTYNFPDQYGVDPASSTGEPFSNQITEEQKKRAREIFEIYSFYAGVQFIEVPSNQAASIGVVTGDLRALAPGIITGEGGVAGIAGSGLAIMEAVDHDAPGDDELGAAWQITAFHEIGHLLGLEHTYDLPPGTIMGSDADLSFGQPAESLLPGDFDLTHLKHLYRPDSIDIDMYSFEVSETGTLSAEIIAERLGDASHLDAVLTLYRRNGDGTHTVIARNDDYYSEDSFLEMTLEPGTYFIGVSASGNNVYDPNIEDSGFGGVTQGRYELQLRFSPSITDTLRDLGSSRQQLSSLVVRGTGDDFADGQTITLRGTNGSSRTFEIDVVSNPNAPANLNNPNNVAVKITADALQSEIVAALVDAINDETGTNYSVSASSTGNRIDLSGLATNSPITLDPAIIQAQSVVVTSGLGAGRSLDGDLDGTAGGKFNFWFRAEPVAGTSGLASNEPRTLFVDATYTPAVGQTPNGSLTNPFNTIGGAIAAAKAANRGDVIRVIGLPQINDNPETLGDNIAYLIGRSPTDNSPLKDGTDIILPKGVTMMIDEGAILKFRNASIQVGSTSVTDDRSFAALQVLGIPERYQPRYDTDGEVIEGTADPRANRVTLTSFRETTLMNDPDGDQIGHASYTQQSATPGNWGGILFNNEVDREQLRGNYEDSGIFLNSIIGAEFRYAGGIVNVDGAPVSMAPIYMEQARPTINYNLIHLSAGAALSADPNSFQEDNYTVFDGRAASFTADINRVGPDIFGNRVVNNSTNGILVRIPSVAGQPLEELTTNARFDSTDIVYVIQETLNIDSTPGGNFTDLKTAIKVYSLGSIDDGDSFTITAQTETGVNRSVTVHFYRGASPAAGNASNIYINLDGADAATAAGDGMLAGNGGPISYGPVTTEALLAERIAEAIVSFRYLQIFEGDGYFLDIDPVALNGNVAITGQASVSIPGSLSDALRNEPIFQARLDASLVVDPNVVVKFNGARIEVEPGASFIAEGAPGRPVVFTSLADDRYGFGGTFDTNNNGAGNAPAPGDWSGIYFGHASSGSIDNAVIAYAGGESGIAGGEADFNAIEIQQAQVRVTNSVLEYNADGIGSGGTREGHLSNANAVIFVRGAQPVIVGNNFRFNEAYVLNVDTSSLSHDLVVDWGRSRGDVNVEQGLADNQGALVRRNLLTDNDRNAMVVRGGTLTTQSVWDDTDIVHLLFNTIYSTNFHTYGGIRLESSATESLVVKLFGDNAGFVATGKELDIDDRIGGMLHVVGQPGFPVVFTDLRDDTVGAGFTQNGTPQVDTNNDGIVGVDAGAEAPQRGSWRGLTIEQFANDRNVQVVVEGESNNLTGRGINGSPTTSQSLGRLAPDEYGGDDSRRLGFEVNGFLSNPADVDVYSFIAEPGTEVWFDIDRSSYFLDPIIELVDGDGNLLVGSSNSFDQSGDSFYGLPGMLTVTNPLQKSGFYNEDFWSTNPRDAGMRVVLPGQPGTARTYHVRVRSSSDNLATVDGNVQAGFTAGVYQLNIRLREVDELAGSTIQFADIRYAENGISVYGQPGHSPVLGESAEDNSNNNTIGGAHKLGNVLNSDRGAISVAGSIDAGGLDVDWYEISFDFDSIQSIPGNSADSELASLMIDLDYSAGFNNANTIVSVYDEQGRLIFVSDQSSVNDDLIHPGTPGSTADLSRGSDSNGDPNLGTIMLPAGTPEAPRTYFVAVSSQERTPIQMNQFYQSVAANTLVRFEPLDSVRRIVEDHLEGGGSYSTPLPPTHDSIITNQNRREFTLGDFVMFLSQDGPNNQTHLYGVDPFTGAIDTKIGTVPRDIRDLAMAPNGLLHAYGIDNDFLIQDSESGEFLTIDTGDASIVASYDDGIITYLTIVDKEGKRSTVVDHIIDPNNLASGVGWGIQFEGTTFHNNFGAQGLRLWAIGNRGNLSTGIPANATNKYANILFEMDASNSDGDGRTLGLVDDVFTGPQIGPGLENNAGYTNAKSFTGRVDTYFDFVSSQQNAILTTDATKANALNNPIAILRDGMTFEVDLGGGLTQTYELEFGNDLVLNLNPGAQIYVKDGMSFQIQGSELEDVIFQTGGVINLNGFDADDIVEGSSFQITDGVTTNTFVFDDTKNGNLPLTGTQIRVPYATDFNNAKMAASIADAVNKTAAALNVTASTAIGNRITFIGDKSISGFDPLLLGGMTLEGTYGLTSDKDTIIVNVEEIWNSVQVTEAIRAAVDDANQRGFTDVEVSVNGGATASINRFNFIEPSTGTAVEFIDGGNGFAPLLDPAFTASVGVGAGNIAVLTGAGYEAIDVANAITAASGGFATNVFEGVEANVVYFHPDAIIDVDTKVPTPFEVGAEGSGGFVTGLAWVGNDLFAVTDNGGFFNLTPGPSSTPVTNSEDVIQADYIGNIEGLSLRFASLSAGPANPSGVDKYADVLFGVTTGGDVYAFDTDGEARFVFQGNRSNISTGISGTNGLQFSTLNRNLWSVQSELEDGSAGHGLNVPVTQSRDGSPGGSSLYFGNLADTFAADNAWGNKTQYDYNFPGDAHGTVISDPFSLYGYNPSDMPTLYFNYLLDTDGKDFQYNGNEDDPARDTLRVFVAGEDGEWHLLATNNTLRQNDLGVNPDDEFDTIGEFSDAAVPEFRRADAHLGTEGVQPLFDNTGWRQARVNLGAFAGQENLRLRFDFSTGGSINLGGQFANGQVLNTEEIRFQRGQKIADGETLSVTDLINGGTTTFEFNKGQTFTFESGGRIVDGLNAPIPRDRFTLTRSTDSASFTFQYVLDAADADPGNIPIVFSPTNSAVEITELTRNVIESTISGLLFYDDTPNTFNVKGLDDYSGNATGVSAVGSDDVSPGNIEIVYDSEISAIALATQFHAQVNEELAPDAFAQGYLMFDRYDEFIFGTGYGFTVGGNGLGHDDFLQGDDFGYGAYSKVGAATSNDNNAKQRGQSNLHRGAFIDDLIIGFAERGEMVTGANTNTAFGHNQQLRANEILEGTYQLEIRRGTDYMFFNPLAGKWVLDPGFDFDTNDRLIEGYTIRTPSGAELGNGDRIRIGDGTDWVTFEFFDLASATERIARGASSTVATRINYDRVNDIYSIGFYAHEQDWEIASRLSQAINDHAGQVQRQLISTTQGVLGVRAQLNSRTNPTTSNRVDLSRSTTSDQVRVEYDVQSDDMISEAFDLEIDGPNLPSGTFATKTVFGAIGDNLAVDRVHGIADIDVYSLEMEANQQVQFTLSTFFANAIGVEGALRLFFQNGSSITEINPSVVDTSSVGEVVYEFTVAQTGRYFASVAGNPIPLPSTGNQAADTLSYDPNLAPRKDANRQVATYEGNYTLEVTVADDLAAAATGTQGFINRTGGANRESANLITIGIDGQPSLEIQRHDTYGALQFKANGDANRHRDQGQIILSSNLISNSENYGILIDDGTRGASNNRPHQGAPRNFPTAQNLQRLATGVTVTNNVIYDGGQGGIYYGGDNLGGTNPEGAVPFGRIINNTLYGTGGGDVGIRIEDFAGPTLLNNIVANFGTGISADTSSASRTEIIRTLYHQNGNDTAGVGLGNFPIQLGKNDPLFVNAAGKNFYLADQSQAIDAARDSVQERQAVSSVVNPLGIDSTPILAPDRDITGQLRQDDPNVTSGGGIGGVTFRDIGAYDRADFTGPNSFLIDPRDNDSQGRDLDASPDIVQWISGPLTNISIQLLDQGQLADQVEGVGIDDSTVTAGSVKLEIISGTETTELVQGVDYRFDYDATNNIIRLVPISGVFQTGVLYKVTLESDPASPFAIRDLANNPIAFNNERLEEDAGPNGEDILVGETRFLIQAGGLIDFGDAADSYGTTLANDGARHNLVDNFYLGSKVNAEIDGQPSPNADAEGNTDDGIRIRTPDPNNPGSFLEFTLRDGVNNQITINATVPSGSTSFGFVDAWVDFNQNGVFDEGEKILNSVPLSSAALTPGGQTFTITAQDIPDGAKLGATTARFRYSSTGGLAPTGLAEDGEVEDYQVFIGEPGRNPWHNANNPVAISLGDNIVTGVDLSLLLRELRERNYTYSSTDVRPPGKFVGDFKPGFEPETVPESLVTARIDVDGNGRINSFDLGILLDYLNNPTANPEPLEQEPVAGSMLTSEPAVVAGPATSSGTVQVDSYEISSPAAKPVSTESLSSSLLGASSFDAMSASYSDLQMRSAVELMGYSRAGSLESNSVDVSFIDEAIALDELANQDQLEQLLGDMAGDLSSAWDGKQLLDENDGAADDDELDDLLALMGDGGWEE